jgi:hypothetical protein
LTQSFRMRKSKIVLANILLAVANVIGFGVIITLAVGASYHPEVSFRFPFLDYSEYFLIFLLNLSLVCLAYSIYIWNRPSKTFVLFTPTILFALLTVSYSLVYFINQNKPLGIKVGEENYKVSWDFNPYAETTASGSYLKLETSFPEFVPNIFDRRLNKANGYRLHVTRLTSPELICFIHLPCSGSRIKTPNESSELARVKAEVAKHLAISPDDKNLQVTIFRYDDNKQILFYQANPSTGFDTYGSCWGNKQNALCNVVFADGQYFYGVRFEPHTWKSVDRVPIARDLTSIMAGTIKLFNSLIVK